MNRTWLTKAHNRKLVEETTFHELTKSLDTIGKMLNGYIKSIGNVSEPEITYEVQDPSKHRTPND